MKLGSVALAAVGVAAGYAVERTVLGRARHRPDPDVLKSFRAPEDAVHHYIPTSDAGQLHLVERGQASGRPLILLHGITLSSLSWHYQVTDLADRFRVLAVDHRGHGESEPGAGAWGLDRLATDVLEVFEALDLRDALLVGHSLGGMVALRFAVDHPDVLGHRVAGLVLLSTAAGPIHRITAGKAVGKIVGPTARALALADHLPGGLFPASDLSHLIFRLGMGRGASPTLVELNRQMTVATPPSVWARLLKDLAAFDVLDHLDAVTVPALVLVGSRDLLTPPRVARVLADALPDATLHVFPGAGHMVMLERPEEVNECIVAIAESLAGGRG